MTDTPKLSADHLRQMRVHAEREDGDLWDRFTLALLDEHAELRHRVAELERELHNVKALAKRMRREGDAKNACHLLRFCERVGLGESPADILRKDP